MVIFSRAIKKKKVDQNMEFVHIAAAAKFNFFVYDDLIEQNTGVVPRASAYPLPPGALGL